MSSARLPPCSVILVGCSSPPAQSHFQMRQPRGFVHICSTYHGAHVYMCPTETSQDSPPEYKNTSTSVAQHGPGSDRSVAATQSRASPIQSNPTQCHPLLPENAHTCTEYSVPSAVTTRFCFHLHVLRAVVAVAIVTCIFFFYKLYPTYFANRARLTKQMRHACRPRCIHLDETLPGLSLGCLGSPCFYHVFQPLQVHRNLDVPAVPTAHVLGQSSSCMAEGVRHLGQSLVYMTRPCVGPIILPLREGRRGRQASSSQQKSEKKEENGGGRKERAREK